MNVRDLEYIVAIAEELHFGRAAARCNASQPALSGQLRKIEEQLGVRLFERTRRQVRQTETGRAIVARARNALREVAAMKRIAASDGDPFAGRLTLGMPPTIGPYLTPLFLPVCRRQLPDLQVDPVEDFTDSLEAQLAEGALDAAVLATAPTRPTLAEIILYREPFWVALPDDHPLAAQDAVDIERLEPSELLLLSDGHCLRDQVFEACKLSRAAGPDSAAPKTRRTSLDTILSLVGAGYGVTLVPAMSLAGGRGVEGGVTVRREQSGKAGRSIRLAHRKSDHRMALIKKLADIMAGLAPDTMAPPHRAAQTTER